MSGSYYSQAVHGPFETFDLGDFDLLSGEKIRSAQLAYATFGTLAADKSNAVLFPSWYSGSNKILELAYVGPGRALDPERHFIILVNQLGAGLSSSPSNTPVPFNAARFPQVAIGDDVRAQHRLVTEKFGIETLALVLGGSMGAQITYDWAVRYPDQVRRAAPIAGTARGTAHNRLLVETFIDAIVSDAAYDGGSYADAAAVHCGLRRHARVFAASGFTQSLFNTKGWTGLGFTTTDDFVTGFVENHFLPQDPNNLLLLLRKWRDNDVTRGTGLDLATALGRITAKTFVIAIDEDVFFPLSDIAAEQVLIAGSSLKRVSSTWGHLALFGVDAGYNSAIDAILTELLA
ncbi:alpha/beta fold hydrolase [Xanthobacter oligotrophicus]|uniref:alpha/beta fold hydrolase n=1 Tax=Xanthobacter oligotrophicus TaxID=2607286 RepID=UPI0011F34993|nr:alpha/beta fold hydrolase [Xanthobacter oligotrophicus]MCG5233714.1 alpha/beta fold hydrolase [Xanthobacter oligotrophicus]